MNNNGFIVYIIGTTAPGKTNLSLNLVLDNYEIISCDSIKIYKDANIMTVKAINKITNKQQKNIMESIYQNQNLNVLIVNNGNIVITFICSILVTINKIQELQSKGKIPVLVGGTHYYIESILFNQEIEENQVLQVPELNQDGKDPFEYLKEIDPLAAEKFHPNDHRRILNSIKYYQNIGQLPSEKLDHHSEQFKLRSNNFLILWPKWRKKENLKIKVTERINEMLEKGGTEEILTIFERLENKQNNVDGVLQSNGQH